MINRIFIGAFAVIGLLVSSCSVNDEEPSYEENYKKGLEYLTDNAQREGVICTQSGLQYEVLREGDEDGKMPVSNSYVRCHYKGSFIDGNVFDSSYDSGNPIVFSLSSVIIGWTEGLQYMKEGAMYRFFIPYYLAYGAYGNYAIPPYSTLIFEVELIEVLQDQ